MNSSISNSYVNIYIANAAMCRDIICSWEYCRRTAIQNPSTFILRLQSKDRTKGSSSKLHTEFSNEKKNQCQILCFNSEAESVRFQKGLSPGQGGGWFLPQISARGQRHLEGASDPRNLQGEGGKPSLLLVCCKAWLPKDPFQQALKASKETEKILLSVLTRPNHFSKWNFQLFSFQLVNSTQDITALISFPHFWCWYIPVGPLVGRRGRRSKPHMEKVEKRINLL